MDEDERDRVTVYTSKKMTPTEQCYTANNRELLALVNGLQRFPRYLKRATFSLITDNQVFNHFFSKSNLSRRETRWLEILADFNISALQLKPERINVLGDALSRIQHENSQVEQSNMEQIEIAKDDLLRAKLETHLASS